MPVAQVMLLLGAVVVGPQTESPQVPSAPPSPKLEVFRKYLDIGAMLGEGNITPNWMADGNRFWYRHADAGKVRYRLVDPARRRVQDLFDVDRLRTSIEEFTGDRVAGTGLPFERFEVVSDSTDVVEFTWQDERLQLELATYQIRTAPPAEPRPRVNPWTEALSPDGRWIAGVENGNVVLRESEGDSVIYLTNDGSDQDCVGRCRVWGQAAWGVGLYWSPDARYLAVGLADRDVTHQVPVLHYPTMESLERGDYTQTYELVQAGTSPTTFQLYVFDIVNGARVGVALDVQPGQRYADVMWVPDGSAILTARTTARGQSFDLVVIDPEDGSTRVLASEVADGGYLYAPNEWSPRWFVDDRRFILKSERDGWQHYYLYDLFDGFIRQLTSGPRPMRYGLTDDEGEWLYFVGHTDPNRPYDQHFGRVSLSGGEMEVFSKQPGIHRRYVSPSRRFIVDVHVSFSQPYRSDLWTTDGEFVMTLESGSDARIREELGWRPPERFMATAADGVTKVYGTLFKPWDFDSTRTYPVIDFFHAMHGAGATPLRNDQPGLAMHQPQALAQLGFIVVTFDDRGTYWRGTGFRNSIWGRGEIDRVPDHVAVLRELAAERPWMNLDRVGAFGYSTFGFRAARAILMAPDFYDVCVSGAGPDPPFHATDIYWNEISEGEGMPYRPNFTLAENLQGRLLLIAGTEDRAGSLGQMMPLITGLVEAGKQYDLRLIPGAAHSMLFQGRPYSDYFWDTVAHYFLEHLPE